MNERATNFDLAQTEIAELLYGDDDRLLGMTPMQVCNEIAAICRRNGLSRKGTALIAFAAMARQMDELDAIIGAEA